MANTSSCLKHRQSEGGSASDHRDRRLRVEATSNDGGHHRRKSAGTANDWQRGPEVTKKHGKIR